MMAMALQYYGDDGGGSRKRKWKGRGTEVWRKRGKVCRCLAFRHIFSVSRQSLMLEVVPPAISFPSRQIFEVSRQITIPDLSRDSRDLFVNYHRLDRDHNIALLTL